MDGFFSASEFTSKPDTFILPQCGRCKLYKGCLSPKMPYYGKGRKNILIVAESPGGMEDAQGRPLVGRVGKFLRETLQKFSIDLDRDCWVTNSLICRPLLRHC